MNREKKRKQGSLVLLIPALSRWGRGPRAYWLVSLHESVSSRSVRDPVLKTRWRVIKKDSSYQPLVPQFTSTHSPLAQNAHRNTYMHHTDAQTNKQNQSINQSINQSSINQTLSWNLQGHTLLVRDWSGPAVSWEILSLQYNIHKNIHDNLCHSRRMGRPHSISYGSLTYHHIGMPVRRDNFQRQTQCLSQKGCGPMSALFQTLVLKDRQLRWLISIHKVA